MFLCYIIAIIIQNVNLYSYFTRFISVFNVFNIKAAIICASILLINARFFYAVFMPENFRQQSLRCKTNRRKFAINGIIYQTV